MITTPGQLMLKDALPEKYHAALDRGNLDEDALLDALTGLAEENPEAYQDVVAKFMDVARDAATTYGGESSVGLSDLRPPPKIKTYRNAVKRELAAVRESSLPAKAKRERTVKLMMKVMEDVPKMLVTEAAKDKSGLAAMVLSGARGNKSQMAQILFGDILLVDAQDRPVPIPGIHGYAEGVTPMEYWAAANGARKGSVSVQFSTADSGYLSKQLNNIGHRLVVTEEDCGTGNGLLVDADDPDNIGVVLMETVGGIPKGTVLTKPLLRKIGKKEILVRSPTTCEAKNGVCGRCSGVRERGGFPEMGEMVGNVAARAVGEPITQTALRCLAEGTPVRMADMTVKPIEEIEEGEWVLGADVEAVTFPVQVLARHDQGVKECSEYVFSKGWGKRRESVVATANHRILANTRKSSCKEERLNEVKRVLRLGYEGAKFYAVYPETCLFRGGLTEPLALLAGVFAGDGIRCTVNTPKISCADPMMIEDMTKKFKDLGIYFSKKKRSYDWSVSSSAKSGARDSLGQCGRNRFANPVKALLWRLGQLDKYAHEKKVAKEILTWGDESLLDYMAGYFVTDGCVYALDGGRSVGVSFASVSRKLLEGIKELLEVRMCVHTVNVRKSCPAGKGNSKRDLYELSFTRYRDVKRFHELLGDRIPGVKRTKLKRLIDEASGRVDLMCRGIRKEARPVGPRRCWDLAVDHPDELFVLANGLIVHNSKHLGGVAGTDDKVVSGFEELNQFLQVPENFLGGAALAEKDGLVTSVEKAPGGGWNVKVGAENHYVSGNRELKVKRGDRVVAGDVLSDGVPNPADVVRHKGIGEGRRYFVKEFADMLKRNGSGAHRRNIEALARGFINRVEITDPEGYAGYYPGDVVPYDDLVKQYEPRPDSEETTLIKARGKYLERPILHYSVGTRITPAVVKTLKNRGVGSIVANAKPPPFKPVAVKARDILQTDPDWMTRMAGENLMRTTLETAAVGGTSDPKGTSYFPAVANLSKLRGALGLSD